MPKSSKTWVLIADGGRARILAARGPGRGFELVAERSANLRKTGEIGADRPGRSFESATTGRHAHAEPDYHREQEQNFLRGLVEDLAARRRQDLFDRLVIVAPPTALGDLRSSIDAELARIVAHEVRKDLTKVAVHDLPAHLADVAPC